MGRLAPEHKLGCLISGLKEMIRTEVQVARPTNLTATVGLARLYKAKHQVQRQPTLKDTRRPSKEPSLPSPALTRVGLARLYKAKHQVEPTLIDNRRPSNEPPLSLPALTRGQTPQVWRLMMEKGQACTTGYDCGRSYF